MNKEEVQAEMTRVYNIMCGLDPASKEYDALNKVYLNYFNLLTDLESEEAKKTFHYIELGAGVTSTLANLLLILNYEKLGIITSKAFGLLKFKK